MKSSRRRLLAATTAFLSIILLVPGTASAIAAAPDEAACRRNLPAAEGLTGHSVTRFDWCRILEFERPVNHVPSGVPVAWFSGLLTIYGTADRSARTATFTINLRNVLVTASQDKAYIGISTTCTAISNVTCSGATNIEQDIDDWQDNADTVYTVTVTSPNDTGIAPHFITHAQVTTHLEFGIRDGRTDPGGGDFSLANVRFDSANNKIGHAPFHGTVFPDNIPKLALSAAAGSPYRQEALHVYDAIHRPIRTFPSFVGKSPPTRLTRYMSDVDNNAEARKICVDVWGRDYSQPPGLPGPDPNRLDCDEYPFASTYQGARLATTSHEYPTGNWRIWHGSARPIHWQQNQDGGNALGAFYGAHRLLDGDAFDVSATL